MRLQNAPGWVLNTATVAMVLATIATWAFVLHRAVS